MRSVETPSDIRAACRVGVWAAIATLFGILGGYVVLVASLFALSRPAERARAAGALGFVSAFAALVFFNYVVQTRCSRAAASNG